MSFPLCYCIDIISNLDKQESMGKFIMSLSLTQYDSNDFLPSDHIYVSRRNVEEVLGNRDTDSSDSLIINDGARRFLLNSSTVAAPTDWPWSTCMTRSSEILFLAINQHYPEIEGGCANPDSLVQRSLSFHGNKILPDGEVCPMRLSRSIKR